MASLILASFAHHNENQPNQNLQFLLLDEKILVELSPPLGCKQKHVLYAILVCVDIIASRFNNTK